MSLPGKRIALLENRLGEHLAELIRRDGGVPLHAPALTEVPDTDPALLSEFLDACVAEPPGMFVFQTGVGTRALADGAKALGRLDQLLAMLAAARVAARGPKPTAVLRSLGVRIDTSTQDPHTTDGLVAALDAIDLSGVPVVVQRYGETNVALQAWLGVRGALVRELPIYRWSLPDDTGPLGQLLDALRARSLDAVVFTSAGQLQNLLAFARTADRQGTLLADLAHTRVVSIGPVCSRALSAVGIRVDLEADPPKLGPLMVLLREQL